MAFDFDQMYVKEKTTPYVDAPSRRTFGSERVGDHENANNKYFTGWKRAFCS